jgi:hypothetical protein
LPEKQEGDAFYKKRRQKGKQEDPGKRQETDRALHMTVIPKP